MMMYEKNIPRVPGTYEQSILKKNQLQKMRIHQLNYLRIPQQKKKIHKLKQRIMFISTILDDIMVNTYAFLQLKPDLPNQRNKDELFDLGVTDKEIHPKVEGEVVRDVCCSRDQMEEQNSGLQGAIGTQPISNTTIVWTSIASLIMTGSIQDLWHISS